MKQALLEDDSTLLRLAAVVKACSGALQAGGKVIFAGNGRSFANAQHRSAEFTSRFRFHRAPLAAVALGTNNSAISAIGNDYDYEQVFARELHATGEPRDVLIAISTTGKRPNIIRAVEVANSSISPSSG